MKKAEITEELEYCENADSVNLSVSVKKAGYADFSINDICFEAKPGEIIGVTGIVASGKSILGKMFIGETPFDGELKFESIKSESEIEDFNKIDSKRHCELISYMGHESELLSTTIKENVALGDEVDVWKYLEMVCLDKEVEALPQKENTQIGNGGMMLSGGQQARLALARTLAHAKSVIVLDDPFSAVDKNTETEILSNIRKNFGDRIILLISLRLYHFPEFQKILFLQDKKAALSNHEKLMTENPVYNQLFVTQLKGDNLDEE